MRALTGHLDQLEASSGPDVRTAVELLIDTGRRPNEIATLMLDCLETDPDGKPVLIYDNHKEHRKGRRLPIAAATATIITEQQERVRARFPGTPDTELRLIPSSQRNPTGRRNMSIDWFATRHRAWVGNLPEVRVPTAVDNGGRRVTKLLPFSKEKIFPYAYRHTYAQRHADAGVDVTVLQELMDHRLITTTQGYHRVGAERRREAVDRVTTMQFDRHGNRVWRQAVMILDSERNRRAVGEVAVPYGRCSEPSNVAAGAAATARSGSSASAATTSAPTSPTCPSWSGISLTCFATGNGSRPPSPQMNGPALRPCPRRGDQALPPRNQPNEK